MTEHAAYVFDLDGVVRDFAPGDATPAIEAALGLPAGHVAATAFRSELLLPTITGRRTFDEWFAAICAALEHVVPEPDACAAHGGVAHPSRHSRSTRPSSG